MRNTLPMLAWLLLMGCASAGLDRELEVVLCQPTVKPVLQLGRASLAVPFTLQFGPTGEVQSVTRDGPDAVDEEAMRKCLIQWRAGGSLLNERVQAEFYWLHGQGWSQLRLVGPGMNVTLKLPAPQPE